MNAAAISSSATPSLNQEGRARMLSMKWEPLLLADWDCILMLHYRVAPEALRPFVPFELDRRDGSAFVSLVAFTMRRLRPRRGGWITRALFAPVASHEFLNVRTYVKHHGEPGIYFLAEWLTNPLSGMLGGPLFGLPYRLGSIRYHHAPGVGRISGEVVSSGRRGVLRYRAEVGDSFTPCGAGSLDEFLMERYTAFTEWLGLKRRFRVWHPPWLQGPVQVENIENSLMRLTGAWADRAKFIGANFSSGFADVWMGRPGCVGNFSSTILDPKAASP